MRMLVKAAVCFFFCMLPLAACESMPGTPSYATIHVPTMTAWEIRGQTATYRPTKTATPTITPTPTMTPVPTIIPMVSPSPGPAPDLEVLNVTISDGWVMGEIRNNTDEPMILPGMETALQIMFEKWIDSGPGSRWHFYYSPIEVKPVNEDMNCILYPHETGVLASAPGGKLDRKEKADIAPFGEGYRILSYEGFYRRWEEFKKLTYFFNHPDNLADFYHPRVENLKYEIEISDVILNSASILINFDVDITIPSYGVGYDFPVWVVLYDKEGEITNILYKSTVQLCNEPSCLVTGRYHIYGAGCNREMCLFANWVAPDQIMEWFRPMVRITPEDMRRVDHIRAFMEMQDTDICVYDVHWDWLKQP
jgi:hypothetical protein